MTPQEEAHTHVKRALTVLGKEHMDWYDVQLARIWLAVAFDKIKEMDMEGKV